MIIPKKVRVAGINYKVEFSSTLQRHRGRWGECGLDDLVITLDAHNAKQRTEETFIHELFEAINGEYDLELEHHQIELLAAALYQVVQDNPKLFKGEKNG